MDNVNIYTCVEQKGMPPCDRKAGYILELIKEGRQPITLTNFITLKNVTNRQAELRVLIGAYLSGFHVCGSRLYMQLGGRLESKWLADKAWNAGSQCRGMAKAGQAACRTPCKMDAHRESSV